MLLFSVVPFIIGNMTEILNFNIINYWGVLNFSLLFHDCFFFINIKFCIFSFVSLYLPILYFYRVLMLLAWKVPTFCNGSMWIMCIIILLIYPYLLTNQKLCIIMRC